MSGTVCEEHKFPAANFSNVYQQAEQTCGLRHGDSQHACRSTNTVNSAQLPNRACINQTNNYMGAVPSTYTLVYRKTRVILFTEIVGGRK